MIEVLPVEGLPEIAEGDDLASLIAAAVELRDGDVVCVAQKVSRGVRAVRWSRSSRGPPAARRGLTATCGG